MIKLYLIGSNKHENKWYGEAETSAEVYRCKLHSVLDNTSPHL